MKFRNRINRFCPFALILLLALGGCGSPEGGESADSIQLDTGVALDLYCEDEGVFPDNCILEDDSNPFRLANLNDENKWELHDDAPSAKARFYLWATMLAKVPTGEHQYYVASSLHELYSEGGSPNAKMQAIKAYRSVLDNFYDGFTYWKATWLPDDPTYAVLVRDLAGLRLYDPSGDGLLDLYDDPYYALNEMGVWGYGYDTDTDKVFRNPDLIDTDE